MDAKKRCTMCWNCEADVNVDATYCPFCGSDLMHEEGRRAQKDDGLFSSRSLDESLASLYQPPYSVREYEGFGVPQSTPPTPQYPREDEVGAPDGVEEEPLVRRKFGGGWPLILLSVGGHLLTLGLLLFFLATGETVTLEWNTKYWFLYCLVSLPILYFGWRMLNEASASEEYEEL